MLAVLELKDFAIVDELRLELAEGLNVFSGETGAGKSILIDALGLLIGARADSSLIRSGADSALVQGIFQGAELESAARRLSARGRGSARLGGELVTVGELAERGGALIAIHGQHAQQTLLSTAEQGKLLDRLLDKAAQTELQRYREEYRDYRRVRGELSGLEVAIGERARRLDILNFQLDEIDAVNLQPGEEETLAEAAQSLRFAERIASGAGQSLNLLAEAEPNAQDLTAQALHHLESAGRYQKELETLSTELGETLNSLQAISSELSSFLEGFEAEPGRLEEVEARLARLEKLKLKYGGSLEAVLAYRENAATEREGLLGAESNLEKLQSEQERLECALKERAERLSAARRKAAGTLFQKVGGHLERLGMAKARFEVRLEPADFGPFGQDNVSFTFSANLGEPPVPLAAVASGGELSRLMLALNVVTGSASPTLAFDEVDAGIGGQAARAVGALLKELAGHHQVLVVTHLAQVAAYADAQFFVEKLEQAGRTVTRVHRLDTEAREAELARMLSGSATRAARTHARELLKEANFTPS